MDGGAARRPASVGRLIPFALAREPGRPDPASIDDPLARAALDEAGSDAWTAALETLERCASGAQASVDSVLPSADGVLWRLSARRTDDGAVQAVLAETPPSQRMALHFQALVENAPYEISLRDRERRFIYVNPTYAAVNAVDAGAVIGLRSDETDQVGGPRCDEDSRRVVEENAVVRYVEVAYDASDARWRRYLTTKFPTYDGSDAAFGVGTYSIDLTEIDEDGHRLRSVMDSLPDAVFAIDADGGVVSVNRAAWRLLDQADLDEADLDEADLNQAGTADAGGPASERRRFEALPWIAEDGGRLEGSPLSAGLRPPRFLGLDKGAGRRAWFEVETRPLEREAPFEPTRLLFLRPCDETMRLRAAKRESERWYRLLAENAVDMVALISSDGRFRYASPSFRRGLGYAPEELIGRRIFELFDARDHARLQARCAHVAGGVDLGPTELTIRDRAGGPRVIECSARCVSPPYASRDVAVVVSMRDITSRRKAEGDRQILQRALDDVMQAVGLFDAEQDECLHFNPAFRDLLGPPGGGCRAFWRRILATPEDDAARGLLESIDRRVPYVGVVGVRWPRTGAVTPVRAMIDWTRDDETGAPRYIVCQCSDYSREYARFEALERAYARERDAHVGKAEMMKALGHDLRQPIFALGLIAQAVSPIIERDDAEMAIALTRSVDSLRKMLGDLAEASALSAGGVSVQPRRFAVAPLLARSAEEFTPAAKEAGIALSVEHGDDQAALTSDPDLLGRILRNLIANALDHSGGTHVWLSARREVEGVRIEVTDDGRGVPADLAPRIFEDYVRRGHGREGLGLGLSIVKSSVDLLGGAVELVSPEEGGARFVIRAPDLPSNQAAPQRGRAGARGA
ncbi:MAG: PAS domain S-box protein [Marivibrio sp.]|uniref:PAS domain-containing sensor histidine kinase n=1 Tax=Marivibrio sp. TaxID=2039719 RepID=UPI0032ECE31E